MNTNYWQGESITLRGIEPEDAEFFYEWNRETNTQYHLDRIWFPSSLERQRQWTAKKATEPVDNDAYFFLIQNLEGLPVGMIHARDCDRHNGHFSYAVAVREKYRRAGYAREAIRMVLDYYFNELGYKKVIVDIYEFNTASLSLHRQLGFREEGRLRQMKYSGGRYFDLFKYGLLRKEFIASREKTGSE